MKAFVATTGIVFALLTFVHIWRIFFEAPQLARDPFFMGVTAIGATLAFWAGWLIWRGPRV